MTTQPDERWLDPDVEEDFYASLVESIDSGDVAGAELAARSFLELLAAKGVVEDVVSLTRRNVEFLFDEFLLESDEAPGEDLLDAPVEVQDCALSDLREVCE
ncbi:MAG: hypothetical protein Kow0069_35240 [Promethearchaeota archaeon]